jgi:hypothetical protein
MTSQPDPHDDDASDPTRDTARQYAERLRNLEKLKQLRDRPVFENRYYSQQRVDLDGSTFLNCCFEECKLETAVGDIRLDRVVIRECKLFVCPPASNVLQFVNHSGDIKQLQDFLAGCDGKRITIPRPEGEQRGEAATAEYNLDDIPF